jgi:NAD(P)-dependent dehydrogenase (short-subunit alcohol dehydrogenase family)
MVTQTLVANGAKVYITGRRKEALETVVQKYSTAPGKIIVYVKYKSQNESISDQSLSLPGDITKKEAIQRLAKEAESQEPKGIQLLVNNAGIARDGNTKYSNSKSEFKLRFINEVLRAPLIIYTVCPVYFRSFNEV